MNNRICQYQGCISKASHVLVMKMLAAEHLDPKSKSPAFSRYDIFSCDEHANEENAKLLYDYLTPGREALEDQFIKAGKFVPDWNRSHCIWIDMGEEAWKHLIEQVKQN